mgnify:FL=1|tara:strand:- start:1064 stop:1582 length:519 start_codon:yes stop_codon:yes gene_type:complete
MDSNQMEVIDNALSDQVFKDVQNYILGSDIAWYHNDAVAYRSSKGLNKEQKIYNHFQTHMVYSNHQIYSSFAFEKLKPLIDLLDIKALIRIKINSYPRTPKVIHHQDHVDYDFKHKGALFFVNSNDGFTVLKNDTKISSVENKLLLFDSSEKHHSTTTSDTNRRITININYF